MGFGADFLQFTHQSLLCKWIFYSYFVQIMVILIDLVALGAECEHLLQGRIFACLIALFEIFQF